MLVFGFNQFDQSCSILVRLFLLYDCLRESGVFYPKKLRSTYTSENTVSTLSHLQDPKISLTDQDLTKLKTFHRSVEN